MPNRAETRSAGRHRRDAQRPDLHSHRAARSPFARERARTVLLTATLATALAVGVAGGTAAASARRHAPVGHAPVGRDMVGSTLPEEPAPTASPPPLVVAATPQVAIKLAGEAVRLKSGPAATKAVATMAPPTAWVNPNPTASVTSCFGQRWGRLHAGVDMAGPNGTPIVAAGAGVVVRAGVASGYGNAVLIDHGNGYLTHYGHLSAITVQVGQRVAAGQQIGNEGSTGHSTGPHLHFEVHEGHYQNPIEPTRWMHEHGVDISGCDTF